MTFRTSGRKRQKTSRYTQSLSAEADITENSTGLGNVETLLNNDTVQQVSNTSNTVTNTFQALRAWLVFISQADDNIRLNDHATEVISCHHNRYKKGLKDCRIEQIDIVFTAKIYIRNQSEICLL